MRDLSASVEEMSKMREALGISVPLERAQAVLTLLRKLALVESKLGFDRTDQVLVVPIRRSPSDEEMSLIRNCCDSCAVASCQFREIDERPRNLLEALDGKIPSDLLQYLPNSYDIVGDVAVVEMAKEIHAFGPLIGLGILNINPHLRLVARKLGDIAGTYRTRRLEIVAGKGSTQTMHREFSCIYYLDLVSVYFNPRLSNERMRIANQVRENERVVDMFAGVGPFSVLIAKKNPDVRICACDINPVAVKYLSENILMNRVAERVVPVLDDATRLPGKGLDRWATRVIMNLPNAAESYLQTAVSLADREGTIHYYTFAMRSEKVEDVKTRVRDIVEENGRSVRSFVFAKQLREVSPGRVQIVLDAMLE